MADQLLKISDLWVKYATDEGVFEAVNGIDFAVSKGETLGIVGETGAGKTTTALAIMGLLPHGISKVYKGNIVFEDKDLMNMPEEGMRQIRGSHISMVFQDPMTSLNPVITVGEQVLEVLKLHNKFDTAAQTERRVEEILELVGISADRKNDYPHQFSGGMKQRIVIAMAIACEPDLLIADEPTTALDVTIQAQVLDMMNQLKTRLNTSLILITHDMGIVAQMCDNVAIMYAGEIVEYGTLEQIFCGEEHHPYTVGLFESIPRLENEMDRLKVIGGLMPDADNLPAGCKFHPRCKLCNEICQQVNPTPVDFGGHTIKCHRFITRR